MLKTSNDKCLIFSDGSSPLFKAVSLNHLELVKFFIEKGADVNSLDDYNISILAIAKRINNTEIINLLEAAGATE